MMEFQSHAPPDADPRTDPSTDAPGRDPEPSGLESLRNTARRRQRWLLGVVLVGGVAAVGTLKSIGGGVQQAQGDTAVEQLIEQFIDGTGTEPGSTNSSEHVLLVLQESYQRRQVPVERLRCNPFRIVAADGGAGGSGGAGGAGGNGGESPERRRQRRLDELESYVLNLGIDSTLTGARPMARIDGELVRPGDTLEFVPPGSVITLVGIERGLVTFRAHDPTLDISGTWTRPVGR